MYCYWCGVVLCFIIIAFEGIVIDVALFIVLLLMV